jgi:hypothetical protein
VPDDQAMPKDLFEQLTLAILDCTADDGLQVIKSIRSYLDTWETFLQDRQALRGHLLTDHNAGPSCMDADPASLNRQHWEAHGSNLVTFVAAHPVQE